MLVLGFLDPGHGPSERVAKLLDFGRRAKFLRKDEVCVARFIANDGSLKLPKRPDEQPRDEHPGQQRCNDPHQEWQQEQQAVAGCDPRDFGSDEHFEPIVRERPAAHRGAGPVIAQRCRENWQLARLVPKRESFDIGRDVERRSAQVGLVEGAGRHPAGDPDAEGQDVLVGNDPQCDIARRDERERLRFGDIADFAQRLPVDVVELELLGDRRRDRQRLLNCGAGVFAVGDASVRRDPQREGIAGDQALDSARREAGLLLRLPPEHMVGVADALAGSPHEAGPDG